MTLTSGHRFFAVLLVAGCAGPPPTGIACVARPLAALPVAFQAGVPTTTVLLDGMPVTMVLDLGAQASVLAEPVVDRLHLSRDPTALPTITGVGGSETRWAASVDHLKLGAITLDDKRVEVAPLALNEGQRAIDGALGLDVLAKYDIDWDLPNRRVTLNARGDCDGPPPGWARDATRVALRHPTGSGDVGAAPRLLLLPVAVDGRPTEALLDTGAGVSLIDPAAAAMLEPAAAGQGKAVLLAGVGAATPSGSLRRFRSLTVAGDTVANWPMVVAPVPSWAGEMVLGVAFLRLHRAWLPAGGSDIWFAPRAELKGEPATE